VSSAVWLGGLITLAIVTFQRREGEAAPLVPAARAFAPLAGTALGVSIVTGVLAAVREIHHFYFLRWSSYGNVLIVKASLVAIAALVGLVAFLRARRGRGSGALLRAETTIVVAVLVAAVLLSGLVPGRSQALPAARG